jgi:PIN domain nuclease of toxin-antitoxin system
VGGEPVILDTHSLVWLIDGDESLGKESRRRIEQATAPGSILISAITPWEIAMLVQKGRLELALPLRKWFEEVLESRIISIAPLLPEIAIDSAMLPGEIHRDPSDRIIIATARHHNLPLLTMDRKILSYGKAGHVAVMDARL